MLELYVHRIKHLIVLSLILLIFGCKSSNTLIKNHNIDVLFSDSLFPIKNDKLWGYADFYGNTIIAPQFEEASLFQYGIAKVKKDELYGYISNNGTWIVKPKYKDAEPFRITHYISASGGEKSIKTLIAKVNKGNKSIYIDPDEKTFDLKKIRFVNSGGHVRREYLPGEYSIRNKDGTYDLKYKYWKITSDTTGYKAIDSTNLKLDTIIALNTNFYLLKKDSKFALYNTLISSGIDPIKNQRYIIPFDSTHTINPQFIYDDVKFTTINGKEYPSSIFKKEGKWGIPGYSNKPIVPFIYNDISHKNYHNYLVEFEENKFGYVSFVSETNHVYKRRTNKNKTYSVVVEHFKRSK